jgi:hypothetical protein
MRTSQFPGFGMKDGIRNFLLNMEYECALRFDLGRRLRAASLDFEYCLFSRDEIGW